MPVIAANRFLVKLHGVRSETVRSGLLPAETVPLYPDEDQAVTSDALSGEPKWFLHTPASDSHPDQHPWDAAYVLARQFKSATLVADEAEPYVEPDLLHQRYLPARDVTESPAASEGAWPAQQSMDTLYPPSAGGNFTLQWHLDRARFPAAWSISTGKDVRIAHL